MAILLGLALAVICLSHGIEAQLLVGFYRNSCPLSESIVNGEVQRAIMRDRRIAAALVKTHFTDCMVGGCDASLLIDPTPNAITLRGLEVVDNAKAKLEAQCPGVVSCADILAFAARDSVVASGGRRWSVPAGRRDARISRAGDIPAPSSNLDEITRAFATKGLSQNDMIALLGAHTIGRSHCTSFSNRLYNFSSANRQDPSLDPIFAEQMKLLCPLNSQGNVDPDEVVPMNESPTLFDNSYYRDVLAHRVVFTSDQTLVSSPESLAKVEVYGLNQANWEQDFYRAMFNMSQVGILTGAAGEIRSNCRIVNS